VHNLIAAVTGLVLVETRDTETNARLSLKWHWASTYEKQFKKKEYGNGPHE
jgi:hypothetical protein